MSHTRIKKRAEHNGPCDGKIGYATREEARAMVVHTRAVKLHRTVLNTYKCVRCGLYHNGRRK